MCINYYDDLYDEEDFNNDWEDSAFSNNAIINQLWEEHEKQNNNSHITVASAN